MLIVSSDPLNAALCKGSWGPDDGCWAPSPARILVCTDADCMHGALAESAERTTLFLPPRLGLDPAPLVAAAAELFALEDVDYAVLLPHASGPEPSVLSGTQLWREVRWLAGRVLAGSTTCMVKDLAEVIAPDAIPWPWMRGMPVPDGRRAVAHLGGVRPMLLQASPGGGAETSKEALVVGRVSPQVEREVQLVLGSAPRRCRTDDVRAHRPDTDVVVVAHANKDAVDLALRDVPPREMWVDLTDADWSRSMRWMPGRDRIAPGSATDECWRI